MAFISARVSFTRFKVGGTAPGLFGADHLEKLAERAIGKQRLAGGDGVEVGWTAGEHLLDTSFDLAKNVINDTLQFGLRIDSLKLPSDLLKAYTAIDLEALAAKNPSGRPSARAKTRSTRFGPQPSGDRSTRRPLSQTQSLSGFVGMSE
jgi:hypothetical protein